MNEASGNEASGNEASGNVASGNVAWENRGAVVMRDMEIPQGWNWGDPCRYYQYELLPWLSTCSVDGTAYGEREIEVRGEVEREGEREEAGTE